MKGQKKRASVGARIIQRLSAFAEVLESGQPIAEQFTCRKVGLNLEPTPYAPQMVKQTRKLLGASQAVFARFLGVSVRTVCSWEQGVNMPSDMACRFMDEIRRNPPYWVERLKEAVIAK